MGITKHGVTEEYSSLNAAAMRNMYCYVDPGFHFQGNRHND